MDLLQFKGVADEQYPRSSISCTPKSCLADSKSLPTSTATSRSSRPRCIRRRDISTSRKCAAWWHCACAWRASLPVRWRLSRGPLSQKARTDELRLALPARPEAWDRPGSRNRPRCRRHCSTHGRPSRQGHRASTCRTSWRISACRLRSLNRYRSARRCPPSCLLPLPCARLRTAAEKTARGS